jgi:hypothetical protein
MSKTLMIEVAPICCAACGVEKMVEGTAFAPETCKVSSLNMHEVPAFLSTAVTGLMELREYTLTTEMSVMMVSNGSCLGFLVQFRQSQTQEPETFVFKLSTPLGIMVMPEASPTVH